MVTRPVRQGIGQAVIFTVCMSKQEAVRGKPSFAGAPVPRVSYKGVNTSAQQE